MRATDTQIRLLLGQLRKARDEVARAWMMMMAAVEVGDEEELEDMVDTLAAVIDSIVKAEEADDDEP
jgi:hypothetical protein